MVSTNLRGISTFTTEEIRAALLGNGRSIRFRYQLLNNLNQVKGFLAGIEPGGRVSYNYLADIKRTLSLKLSEIEDTPEGWFNYTAVDWNKDRLKIIVQIGIGDDWVSIPVGVFLIDAPMREIQNGIIFRKVKGFDLSKILRDDKFSDRYALASGVNIVDSVVAIMDSAGVTDHEVIPWPSTLPADRSWEPGTQKLQVINDLLGMISYGSLWFDGEGIARAHQYIAPSQRTAEFEYVTDSESIMSEAMSEEFSLFEVPNKWTLVVSQPDRAVISATFTNDSGTSPTSTVNRGRTILDFRTLNDAASQADLNNKVRAIAHEASQVYQHVEFSTAIVPLHGENNVLDIRHDPLAVQGKFSEMSWDLPLAHGELMTHRVRKVVTL